MPGLLVASIPQCKLNRHDATCLELFQAIGSFKSSFIEAYQVSKIICNVRLLKSRIKTNSFVEEFITVSKGVFKNRGSAMAVRFRTLGDLTQEIPESNDTVMQTTGSQILTLQLQVK